MKRVACILALLCCACSKDTKPASSFAVSKVIAPEIAKLESALAPAAKPAAQDPELHERVRGLVLARVHALSKMKKLALDDARAIGDPAVPIVAEMLDEKDLQPEDRMSALEVLGAIDTERSAEALARRIDVQRIREPWQRAQAAFQLSKLSSDHVVPLLIAQLKYESDGDTVIWMAVALAKHTNYAGADALRVIATSGATEELRAQAGEMLAKIALDAGFADGNALIAAWNSADPERKVPRAEPSRRLRLEMWRAIGRLAEFDLKLVDDARYALSGSGWWIVDPLVAALHEEDAHVRVHVAQCLQRMGARASAACNALVLALDEPHMAATAATALGHIGCASALDALVRRTQAGTDSELRTAAATALGHMGSPLAIPALRALLAESEPLDVRQTAAQALVALRQGRLGARQLVKCLTEPGADAAAAETALERWLTDASAAGDAIATVTLRHWREFGGDPQRTATPKESRERQVARAQLLNYALQILVEPARVPHPEAQRIVEEVAARHPDVVRLTIHAVPHDGTRSRIIASNVAAKIDAWSDPEDIQAMTTKVPVVLREGENLDYTAPVVDASGKAIASVGVAVHGTDETKMTESARRIAKELATAILTAGTPLW